MNKDKYDIAKTTYAFSIQDADKFGRDIVKRVGVQGEGTILAEDEKTIVVRWKGYGENPGSRYSGLYSYYPSETEVFAYDHTDKFERKRYTSLISYPTKPVVPKEQNE